MNERSLINTLISKKIFWITLCCLLVIGLVLGGMFLQDAYISNRPHNMIVKTKSSGVWVFDGAEHFFSINTQFNRKVEIDKSKYEEIKDKVIGSLEFVNPESVLLENDIVFNNDEDVILLDDFIFYSFGTDEVEYYKFNIIQKSYEKINFHDNISFINNRSIKLIEVAVINLFPNIANEINQIISQNPQNSTLEYVDIFVNNDRVVFEIVEQYKGTDTLVNFKLYEYQLERSETIFLIDIENTSVEEVIFIE